MNQSTTGKASKERVIAAVTLVILLTFGLSALVFWLVFGDDLQRLDRVEDQPDSFPLASRHSDEELRRQLPAESELRASIPQDPTRPLLSLRFREIGSDLPALVRSFRLRRIMSPTFEGPTQDGVFQPTQDGWLATGTLEAGLYTFESTDDGWRLPTAPFAVDGDGLLVAAPALRWESELLPEAIRNLPKEKRGADFIPLLHGSKGIAEVAKDRASITITVSRLYTIHARVLSPLKQPLAGADVRLSAPMNPTFLAGINRLDYNQREVSDSLGSVVFTGVLPGDYVATPSLKNYFPQKDSYLTVAPQSRPLEIVMTPAFELNLRVLKSDGTPADGANVNQHDSISQSDPQRIARVQ